MAKARRRVETAENNPGLVMERLDRPSENADDEEIEELSPAESENQQTWQEIKASFNQDQGEVDWLIRVYLVTGPAKLQFKQPWLFDCNPADLPIDQRLRDEYGSGKYKCKCYTNGRYFRSFEVEVMAPNRPHVAANHSADISNSLAQLIEAGNQRMERLVETLLTRPTAPAVDPIAMLGQLTTIMANMRAASPEPASNSTKEMLDIFSKGLEMAREFGGSSGAGETGVMDVFRDIVKTPAISNLLASFVGGRAGIAPPTPTEEGGYTPPQNQIQAPQPQRYPDPPLRQPGNQQQDPAAMQAMIRQQMLFLIGKAQQGSDPELWAEVVLDMVPAETKVYLLNNPNVLSELLQTVPEMAPYMGWFQRLLADIKEFVAQEKGITPHAAPQPNPVNPGGAGGNDGDIGPHGPAGA